MYLNDRHFRNNIVNRSKIFELGARHTVDRYDNRRSTDVPKFLGFIRKNFHSSAKFFRYCI